MGDKLKKNVFVVFCDQEPPEQLQRALCTTSNVFCIVFEPLLEKHKIFYRGQTLLARKETRPEKK